LKTYTHTHTHTDIDQIPAELIIAVLDQFALRIIISLILFGMRRNCLRRGRIRSLYLFIRRIIKQIIVLILAYHVVSYLQNFIKYSAVKFESICRG